MYIPSDWNFFTETTDDASYRPSGKIAYERVNNALKGLKLITVVKGEREVQKG